MKIAGSMSRSFTFPAEIVTAMRYYEHLPRLIPFLPHIRMIGSYGDNQYRLVFASTEMGAYQISIYANVQTLCLPEERSIRIFALEGKPTIKSKSTFNSTEAEGYYTSEALFTPEGEEETRIEYRLELAANLLRPKGLSFMPALMVNSLSQNITNWRIREIMDGFIDKSLDAFPEWYAQQQTNHHAV